jgi:hypothetical protein
MSQHQLLWIIVFWEKKTCSLRLLFGFNKTKFKASYISFSFIMVTLIKRLNFLLHSKVRSHLSLVSLDFFSECPVGNVIQMRVFPLTHDTIFSARVARHGQLGRGLRVAKSREGNWVFENGNFQLENFQPGRNSNLAPPGQESSFKTIRPQKWPFSLPLSGNTCTVYLYTLHNEIYELIIW